MDINLPVSLESSKEDLNEKDRIEKYISDTCSCETGPGHSSCSTLLTRERIEKCRCRRDNLELPRDELDLVVLGQICALCSVSSQPTPRLSHHKTSGLRQKSAYYIHGVPNTFLFLHCMSKKRLENLVSQYDNKGLTTHTHGNTKRLPPNALGADTVIKVTTFIANYARVHTLPLPGRVQGHRDKVLLLPSYVTKVFVYSKYRERCENASVVAVGRSGSYSL